LKFSVPAEQIHPIIYNIPNLVHHQNLRNKFSQVSHMGIQTRKASMADVASLIRIRMMAEGGFAEALFEGLDQSVEEIIETELSNPKLTANYNNYWVALSHDEIVGGLHAFPWNDYESDSHNPLVPEERYVIMEPFEEFEAPGNYHIAELSVYPEFTRQGIGSVLLGLAREHAIEGNFTALSLMVFEENTGAVSLYKKHGYRELDRRLVEPHPRIIHSGVVLLMTCQI
jgi:ribosomal protein S18 acetylase RimI-like enzyme